MRLPLSDVEALLDEFGSPLFVVWEKELRHKAHRVLQKLRAEIPNGVCAYSYKTNPVLGVCTILHQEGYLAEAVSTPEYRAARRMEVAPNQIVLNGPYKGSAMQEALITGALVNLDSEADLADAEDICHQHGEACGVGIRVNTAIGDLPWSKFGFSLDSGDALAACRRVTQSPWLRLRGLHVHIGTNILDAELYRIVAARLAVLFRDAGIGRDDADSGYVDCGGGFAVEDAIPIGVDPEEWRVPRTEDYFAAIRSGLCDEGLEPDVTVVLEPGRLIVANAMSLLTRVVALKTIDGRRSVIVDGGVNIVPSAHYMKHPIRVVRADDPSENIWDVYGPLCTQYDVLSVGVRLGTLAKGDILQVDCVGAYTIGFAAQFAYPRPAVILWRGGGRPRVANPGDVGRHVCQGLHPGWN